LADGVVILVLSLAWFCLIGGMYYLLTEPFGGFHLMIISAYLGLGLLTFRQWAKSGKM
jgi:hypothetical protein